MVYLCTFIKMHVLNTRINLSQKQENDLENNSFNIDSSCLIAQR